MKNVFVLAFAAAGVFACLPAHAEKVGNVGAVNVAAHGTPPGAAKRALSIGLSVEKRERVETAGEGSAQIVFNDSSTMTVGRNSSVVIDDFVYNGSGGSQGVSMARGVMRFVGGGVSHGSSATFKTPTASIGVRGGSIMVRLGGECEALIYHQNGVTEVAGVQEDSQVLNRPGFGVCARSSGVSEPFRVPPETVAAMNAEMASRGGQSGGAKKKPRPEEAELLLGQDRAPAIEPPPGLDALGPVWAGNALVESRANVENQPGPPPAQDPSCQGEACGAPRN